MKVNDVTEYKSEYSLRTRILLVLLLKIDNPFGDTNQVEQSSVNVKKARISEENLSQRWSCEAVPRPISEKL